METLSNFGQVALKWDPKNLEIRTMSVEKTLEPLVLQVTTLVSTKGPSKKKKGKSKRASALVAAVEKATDIFIERGEQIAYENPDITQEMLSAVEEVRKTGSAMSIAAREFSEDPCSSLKRGNMVRAARNLLSAVTRLLILADMVDVHLLLKSLHVVEDDLDKLRNASSQDELMNNMRQFGRNANELIKQAAKRQQELKDPQLRDDLAAARAVLKKHSTMLLTASKVYVRHPELDLAKVNRDHILKQVCEAVNTISDVAQGKSSQPQDVYVGAGELAAALDDFDEGIIMDPRAYNEVRSRPSLEERLESIISAAALMADADCTRDERRERIVGECNAVRQALQDLLSEYMSNMGTKDRTPELERAIGHMYRKTKDLRRQLRKAVVDHVSDSFLETNMPLLDLIEAARGGNEKVVRERADIFTKHAEKLVEVANLVCSMSNNEDGVKMVRYAADQIETLCPQVINAALILAARPNSKVAQENMEAYRQAWENQVRILTEAVDDITTIDDFLAVSENHILEDVNKCVLALQEGDALDLRNTAGAIQGRSARVCNVVEAEMDNYEPCIYTKRVLEAVKVLREQVMSKFAQRVDVAVDALSSNSPKDVDENDFIDASRLVYDGVREIRRAVLMNRSSDELDTDTEFEPVEDMTVETRSRSSAHTGDQTIDEYPEISGITTAREAMRKMNEEDKQKIMQQVELFRREKLTFDSEVAKWDDTGNDIIYLAKHMCMIMMEMTDFTRGRGPLKTTMDVINAAKKISEAGTKLDKLTREIADQCPESSTKKDLLAYLQRIALYCHQIQITSKVKADVQNISGELIVSGVMLDSATSLIQAAKNLMNAVVYTVKYSYVASTKYTRQGTVSSPIVVWKMKAPEKKPLVRPEKPEEVRAKVRRASQKKTQNPVHALSEFQSPTDAV
ncbi:catenin alpha isoform X2 [Anopheles maculipalpis]|uniref:Alpha-catenin n=1 Tax=Anopheles dirus TaxID=7168 RepID=A0A182NKV8_9DIPT|nr:catenin alpha isoform X2 [Anopheles stephensi]XP_049276884.1 catenin alpha isoform X1 [Anopheles funestus]XP_049276885.1 catenin alpha isoform X1 [Anopheles funestus]XP_050068581.1 catenin alpha isoform X2 [Anopheles maculipalpis]XP_052888635.1 catenin alpha isoform X1 [Anopheles moucheti]